MIKKIFLATATFFSGVGALHAALPAMPAYDNTILDIHVISGNSTYAVVIKTQQADPIINYAPASYQESVENTVYRAFMPQTAISDGLQGQDFCKATHHGVEFVLPGKMKSKVVHDKSVMIVMSACDKEVV